MFDALTLIWDRRGWIPFTCVICLAATLAVAACDSGSPTAPSPTNSRTTSTVANTTTTSVGTATCVVEPLWEEPYQPSGSFGTHTGTLGRDCLSPYHGEPARYYSFTLESDSYFYIDLDSRGDALYPALDLREGLSMSGPSFSDLGLYYFDDWTASLEFDVLAAGTYTIEASTQSGAVGSFDLGWSYDPLTAATTTSTKTTSSTTSRRTTSTVPV